MSRYDNTRYCHNLNRAPAGDVDGYTDSPVILPTPGYDPPDRFLDFNYAVGHPAAATDQGVHFFLADYRFERLWNSPDAYLPLLRRARYVLSPDFSLFSDWPQAVQMYNHWRKHWLGRYLQDNGVRVIPTVGWSTPSSWGWCFDGEPTGSVVAVSSRGCMRSKEAARAYREGFEAMVEQLEPVRVLAFGKDAGFYGEYPGLVVPVQDEYGKRLAALERGRER